jgi:hypothetical protein
MYLSDTEHRLWTRYLTVDQLRYYRRILETTPDLERFYINGSTSDPFSVVDDEQIVELATSLCLHQGSHTKRSTIIEIKVEFFTFSKTSWIVLCNALNELPKLKRIYLRQVQVIKHNDNSNEEDDDDDDDTEGKIYLPQLLASKILQKCPQLEELHLVDCGLTSMVAQALSRKLISRKNKLRVLSLEGNSIGNIGVKCIAKALEGNNNSSLIALDIDRVGCSYDGIHALSKSLKQNARLNSLSCVGNGGLDIIQKRRPSSSSSSSSSNKNNNNNNNNNTAPVDNHVHIQAPTFDHPFEELLTVNTTLKKIQPGNITHKIDYLLRLNRAGRKYIGDTYVTERLFHLVLAPVSNDIDVLYNFLHAWSGNHSQQSS